MPGMADGRRRLARRQPAMVVVLVRQDDRRAGRRVGGEDDLAREDRRLGVLEHEGMLVAERAHREIESGLLAELAGGGGRGAFAALDPAGDDLPEAAAR